MTQILSRIVTINAKLKMAAAHLFYLLGITVFSIAEDHIRKELVMMLNVTPCLHVTVLIAIVLLVVIMILQFHVTILLSSYSE